MTERETVFTLEAAPIVFGPGASEETGYQLERLGVTRALVVTDARVAALGLTERVVASIRARGIETELYDHTRIEPDDESALDAIAAARDCGYDGFVGVGVGSALDTAKVCALFATHGGELLDLAAPSAGIGFGNAGVHVPHACVYPVASLKHEWTPPGYPDKHPFVPHGFSVAVCAPAAFRFTGEATRAGP